MSQPEESSQGSQAEAGVVAIKQRSPLDEALREGARQMLLKAIETEVADYVEAHQQEVDEKGRGKLSTLNTNGGFNFVPLSKIGNVSVRRLLDGTPDGQTVLEACGAVRTNRDDGELGGGRDKDK